MGLVYLFKPAIPRAIMRFFLKGIWLYFAALVRFALAIVFFLGARECEFPRLIFLFGLIMLVSGLLIFILGLQKGKEILGWFLEQPVFMQRILALIVLATGLIIVIAA